MNKSDIYIKSFFLSESTSDIAVNADERNGAAAHFALIPQLQEADEGNPSQAEGALPQEQKNTCAGCRGSGSSTVTAKLAPGHLLADYVQLPLPVGNVHFYIPNLRW